eukprot:8656822-Pyramimonas_sp.AAC.1
MAWQRVRGGRGGGGAGGGLLSGARVEAGPAPRADSQGGRRAQRLLELVRERVEWPVEGQLAYVVSIVGKAEERRRGDYFRRRQAEHLGNGTRRSLYGEVHYKGVCGVHYKGGSPVVGIAVSKAEERWRGDYLRRGRYVVADVRGLPGPVVRFSHPRDYGHRHAPSHLMVKS